MRSVLKKIVFFVIVILSFNKAFAADTLYFVGNIKILNTTSYKYNLRFVVKDNKKIVGYSLSDAGGLNEVKTSIVGTFDSSKNILTFEEKNVLRTKVDVNKNEICFVRASLKIKKTKLFEEMTGNFTAFEIGKTTMCGSGTIKLINTNKVKGLLKKINDDKPVDEADIDLSQYKEKVIKLSDETAKQFLITGNEVKLSIWDNGQVDGDKISILLNEKPILENYEITNKLKLLTITLESKEINTLKIIALNEGALSPNTAAVKLESASETYPILSVAKANETRVIYLKQKNK